MKDYLSRVRIKGQELIKDTEEYLISKYNQSKSVFTYSTSFGQILLVIMNLFKNMMYYLQDVASEKNITTSTRKHNVYGMSRLTGHDPATNRSATGDIIIKWKNGQSSNVALPIYVQDGIAVECVENTLKYVIKLSKEYKILGGDSGESRIIGKIVQGYASTKSFIGTGTNLQSYNVPGNNIDKDSIIVEVNGIRYDRYESIYDIPYGGTGFLSKTGINGGIDIYFGTSPNVSVPPSGSSILVEYIINDGEAGNIKNYEYTTIRFIDEGVDGNGSLINLNDNLSAELISPVSLGANSEPIELTKLIAPMHNKSMIIHDRLSLLYELRRMNLFSSINIIDDTNIPNKYDVYLLPKLSTRFISDNSYFSSDITNFQLSDDEILAINKYLYQSGKTSMNMNINIKKPTIKKYVLYAIVNLFDSYNGVPLDIRPVKINIVAEIEKYLINTSRAANTIPISDLIGILENVDYIDSVRIIAIGESNELAKINDPNGATVGFDNTGDIQVNDNEIAVIRGGWSDRNGNYYDDVISYESNTSIVNIIVNKIVKT